MQIRKTERDFFEIGNFIIYALFHHLITKKNSEALSRRLSDYLLEFLVITQNAFVENSY